VSFFAELWARRGLQGLAGSLWSRTLGRLFDVSLVLEWEVAAAGARFAPVPGYQYAQAPVSADSRVACEAAALLRVCLDERTSQDLFVVSSAQGQVVGCTWNDAVEDGRAAQRGVAIDPLHRRKGLGGSLLRFQASALAAEGASVVHYRTPLGNRASRRLFEKLGARRARSFAVVSILGRGRAITLPSWLDRLLPGGGAPPGR
jgi:ribosomal protein S18 acetylase RimI-like enzyme